MSDFQKRLDEALQKMQVPKADAYELEVQMDYDVFAEVSNQLIAIRNEAGLTQKDLATKTGLTQAVISRIESGCSRPTIETLKRIADGLRRRLVISFEELEGEEMS